MKVDPNGIPSKESLDNDWIIWHKAMKAEFGKKQANVAFLAAWKLRNADGILVGGKANTVELREYLESQGIKIASGALSYVADTLDDVQDMFASVVGTASKVAVGVAVVIFLVLIYAVIRIVRNPDQYASLIKTVATRGVA
jgi:hypothetical protein